eukprot:scaffold380012_cov51-Attheya_sp.AAC.1
MMLEVIPTSVEEEKRKHMVRYEETRSILKNASQDSSLLREQEEGEEQEEEDGGKEDSIDQRKNKRGSAVRHRVSYEQKANMIEEYIKSGRRKIRMVQHEIISRKRVFHSNINIASQQGPRDG